MKYVDDNLESKKQKKQIFLIVKNQYGIDKGIYKFQDRYEIDRNFYLNLFGFEKSADVYLSSEEHTENPNTILKHILIKTGFKFKSYKCISRKKKGNLLVFLIQIYEPKIGIDLKPFLLADKKERKKCNRIYKHYLALIRIEKNFAKLYSRNLTIWEKISFFLALLIFIGSLLIDVLGKSKAGDSSALYSITLSALLLSVLKISNSITNKIISMREFSIDRKCVFLTEVSQDKKDTLTAAFTDPKNLSNSYEEFKAMNFIVKKSEAAKKEGDVFLYNDKENNHLKERAKDIKLLTRKEKNLLPADSWKALAAIVSSKLDEGKVIFNGKLLGVDTELNFEHINAFYIKKVRYHDYISCDELVFKNIHSTLNPNYFFEGKKMCTNPESNGLRDVKNSPLTNLIGVNLIVKINTKDNGKYYIINEQSTYNDVNAKKLVPSASGSAEQKDFKKNITLETLLKTAMIRELKEECFLAEDLIKQGEFSLLGFARLISKGGKPDFFGILEIADVENIYKLFSRFNLQQKKRIGKNVLKSSLESSEMLLISENDFFNSDEWDNYASPQLRYLKYLLK